MPWREAASIARRFPTRKSQRGLVWCDGRTAIGLEPSTDAAANLFLRYPGREPDLPPVLIGSHIDSQPTGGKFDGAFGVVAGLETVEAIIASGCRPRRTIDVVSWMNEEGSRFAPGMMGSAVFSGARRLSDILAVHDKAGVSVEAELDRVLRVGTPIAAAAAGTETRSISGNPYRARTHPGKQQQVRRYRNRHPRQADFSGRGRRRGKSRRYFAAKRPARRARRGGRYRSRAAGRDVGSRRRRAVYNRHVQRHAQCAFSGSGPRRLFDRSATPRRGNASPTWRRHPENLSKLPRPMRDIG